MKRFAVIDTNVILSALISKKSDAATVRVLRAVLKGKLTPLYHQDILAEYAEVLKRPKFHLKKETVKTVLTAITEYGIEVFPKPTGKILVDADDLIFYEVAVAMHEENAYLVTGNQKHYPVADFIVTLSKIMEILEKSE